MKEFLYYIGFTAIGIILYFIGNLLMGERNEGGKRMILAIAGIISGLLGYYMARHYLGETFPTSCLAILGIGFLGFGVYLFSAALFASQKHVIKLFDGILRGWSP